VVCALFLKENHRVAAVPTGNPVNTTNSANIGTRNSQAPKKSDIARPYADTIHQEVKRLPKDSQMDNKKKRWEKSNGQTPIGKENQNQNRNAKKHSVKNNDV
jgi:hypothetical protein